MNTHQYQDKAKEELIALLLKQAKEIEGNQKELELLAKEILYLKELLALYQQRQFGRKAEQQLFDKATLPSDVSGITQAEESISMIEEEAKNLSSSARHKFRREVHPQVLPKSPLGVVVNYTLKQWPKFQTYLQDGRLENNNNRSERAIKPFAIGRKGWLFNIDRSLIEM